MTDQYDEIEALTQATTASLHGINTLFVITKDMAEGMDYQTENIAELFDWTNENFDRLESTINLVLANQEALFRMLLKISEKEE